MKGLRVKDKEFTLNLIEKFLARQGYIKQKNSRRNYTAAATERLFAGWTTASRTADEDIRRTLKIIRARARELERNNDYAKKFLKLCVANIVGPNGMGMQNKAKDFNGALDKLANDQIEEAWQEWGKKRIVILVTSFHGLICRDFLSRQ